MEITGNACAPKFEDGFFPGPQPDEGDFGLGMAEDEGALVGIHGVAHKVGFQGADGFDVESAGLCADEAAHCFSAMAQAEVYVGIVCQERLAGRREVEEGRSGDAIFLLQSPAKFFVGQHGFPPAVRICMAQGRFLAL